MAVAMKLIRRPRTRVTTRAVRKEIKAAYNVVGDDIVRDLNALLTGWSTKPKFQKKVFISPRQWRLEIRVDRRTRGGKRFTWSDKGTGLYGPKKARYPIRPKRAKALRFRVPHRPKTLAPGQAMPSGQAKTVVTQLVMHPGIRPRKFTARTVKKYSNRMNRKGFYRRTENAARRGFRAR